ncbi:hypothetical protein UL57_13060 [Shigella boydii]|nr:hypothetical protein UL57_13060 [Shigella boydii]
MSLMVSRFCILLSCNVLFNYLSLTLPVHSAMGKVWFIVGLVASRYYIAIDATNIIGFSLLFAALFSLTGGYMEPHASPSTEIKTFPVSPSFHGVTGCVRP